jgi:hypothetical protein
MGAAFSLTPPTIGEDLSLIWVTFLSLAPLPMSDSSAPCDVSRAPSYPPLARDVLFLRPPAASLLAPSCQASAAAVAALQRPVPWAAWAEGEVERAWCRVPRPTKVPPLYDVDALYGVMIFPGSASVRRVSVVVKLGAVGHSVTVAKSQPHGFVTPELHPNPQLTTMTPRLPMRLRSRPVCQLCDYILQQPANRRTFVSAPSLKAPLVPRQSARRPITPLGTLLRTITTTSRQLEDLELAEGKDVSLSDRIAALKTKLAAVEAEIRAIYASPKVESEAAILQILDGLDHVARQSIAIRSRQPLPAKVTIRQSSAGAILSGLSGDENAASTQKKTKAKSFGLEALPSPSHISRLAEDFIKNEKVFLSPNVLGLYIHLQRILAHPRAIPEALHLYANKPVPEEGTSPPKFTKPSPKSAKQAVPADLADAALSAAIDAKDLTLALSVVDHTYRTPAWKRHRMISKMGLPSALVAITPLAIYSIAQELSVYSSYIDPTLFKVYAFAGISTYVLCTGTLGFVALTTYNDHHDRVVWRPGVPLLDRYIREDERAALDRIACAWGFKELWKRGDEEGDEWEGLRQWILLRGMVLDKPDLMPGMNAQAHTREL